MKTLKGSVVCKQGRKGTITNQSSDKKKVTVKWDDNASTSLESVDELNSKGCYILLHIDSNHPIFKK